MQGGYLPAAAAQGCGHFAADSARGSQDQGFLRRCHGEAAPVCCCARQQNADVSGKTKLAKSVV
jgi:hypothetical protein